MPFTREEVLTWCPRPDPRVGSYPDCIGDCNANWHALENEGYIGTPLTHEEEAYGVADPPAAPPEDTRTSGAVTFEGDGEDGDSEEEDVPRSRSDRPWLMLGIELEGGWNCSRDSLTRKSNRFGADAHGDGSVHVPGCSLNYEIATKPYKSLRWALRCLDEMYPDGVNHSCGMHVHVSFPEHVYGKLMSEHFYFYFLLRWESWGKRLNIRNQEFWKRLRGENNYCKRGFRPYGQLGVRGKGEERYYHLNYCYGHLKTIECRLLPMFREKDIAAKAVKELLAIYTDYIAEYGDGTSDADAAHVEPIEDVTGDSIEETLHGEIVEDEPMIDLNEGTLSIDPDRLLPAAPGTLKMITVGANAGSQLQHYNPMILAAMTNAAA